MIHQRRLETTIQREIEIRLGAERDLLLLRNSVGEARHVAESGRSYFVPYGLGVGSPDLVGILRLTSGVGRWFCLEIKTMGGRVEPEQTKCHNVWRTFGAYIEVVRSAKEAYEALERARVES